MTPSAPPLAVLAALALCACGVDPDGPDGRGRVAPDADASEIVTGPDGRCYGRTLSPAVIETVTEQVMVRPAQLAADGAVVAPATFRTVTRQRILRERREQEFEALCPADLTPDFIASLQRALIVRGALAGPVTATLDDRTRDAIRGVQGAGAAPNSPVLARDTAVELGLVPLRAEELDAISP